MGTELVLETSEHFNILTRLLARENFTEFSHRENVETYIKRKSVAAAGYSTLWRIHVTLVHTDRKHAAVGRDETSFRCVNSTKLSQDQCQ
jgi:hypothetical protein